jgi:hypothetical protein
VDEIRESKISLSTCIKTDSCEFVGISTGDRHIYYDFGAFSDAKPKVLPNSADITLL